MTKRDRKIDSGAESDPVIPLDETTMITNRRADLLQSDVEGETFALDIDSGTCYGFNATASVVWDMAKTPVSLAQLLDRLTEDFDVSREQCARTTSALLRQLQADGLVALDGPERP